jgi:hypothetical protein|tara:strand:- start:353 stop:721 length:369 start_codon:yes stop_codon:yes gene_type:complete
MAKFLKVPLTGVANTPYQLVGIDSVVTIEPGDAAGANLTTAVTIQTGKPAGAATITFTADAAAVTAGDLLKAFNDALVANPGGIVSTVTGPVTVAQVLDSTDGRQLITTAQVNALFTGVAIA